MRIRKRKTLRIQNTVIFTIFLLPLVFTGFYMGIAYNLYYGSTAFTFEIDSDPSEFYPLEDIDLDMLEEMAQRYEFNQELRHIPHNISQGCRYNATSGEVKEYFSTDNGGLHTGEALAASCFRLGALPLDSPERTDALRLIRKMFTALKMMIEVPNGGLGPEYSGVIARFYASPEMLQDGNYTWMGNDHYKHFNGTGKYSEWKWRGYTSRDELGGYLMGLACVLKFAAPYDIWINENVKLVIAQLTEEYLNYYYQVFHGDGTPSGAHFQFPTSTEWKLVLMKMASLAFPENKRYSQLYNYFLSREQGYTSSFRTGPENVVDAYYGYAFSHHVYLALFTIEEDQLARDYFFRNYQESYRVFLGHRNAYHNTIYLAMTVSQSGQFPVEYNVSKIRHDVLDQLWRFNLTHPMGYDDTYNNQNRTINREERDPLGQNWTLVDPYNAEARDFIENNTIGASFKFLIENLFKGLLEDHYLKAATVDMASTSMFHWNQSPFKEDGVNFRRSSKRVDEDPGASFTLPYYIMKYYGLLSES